MIKLTYLVVAAAALGMVVCNGNKPGYVITGTIEGATDGDTVLLQKEKASDISSIDSKGISSLLDMFDPYTTIDMAIIKNNSFTLKGVQDSARLHYLAYYKNDKKKLFVEFFPEKGNIKAHLENSNYSITGTPSNDIFQQELRKTLNQGYRELDKLYTDTILTEKEKNKIREKLAQMEEQVHESIKSVVQSHPDKGIGIVLLGKCYDDFSIPELNALLDKIPAKYQQCKEVIRAKEYAANSEKPETN